MSQYSATPQYIKTTLFGVFLLCYNIVMNDELKNKIELARKNETYWNDETMINALIKQGYKKEDINSILIKINTAKNNTVANFYGSIWFWWIFTTIIYILLGSPTGYITGFIGLFVPYGRLSLIVMELLPVFSIISLIFFVVSMILIDKLLKRVNILLYKRILLNLLALFIITMVVDFLRFTPFGSIDIFLNGGI